jgi:NAD(P)-dependent dehydrogenase (short-subunit alcohol dehydrogenase family)
MRDFGHERPCPERPEARPQMFGCRHWRHSDRTADEIARGAVFLASSAWSFTTDTNLVIDGALTKGVQL